MNIKGFQRTKWYLGGHYISLNHKQRHSSSDIYLWLVVWLPYFLLIIFQLYTNEIFASKFLHFLHRIVELTKFYLCWKNLYVIRSKIVLMCIWAEISLKWRSVENVDGYFHEVCILHIDNIWRFLHWSEFPFVSLF